MRSEIRASATRVEAWSDVRLSFEPRDEALRHFRDELRHGISGLHRHPVLRAVYQSADAAPCDVENVSLYNVGSAPFRGLGTEALVVERPRGFSPISPSGAPLAHYLGYEAGVASRWDAWRPHRKLVQWSAVPLTGQLTATSVWTSLKRARPQVHRRWDGVRRLGVVVRLTGDCSLVGAVKALIDGVVSAAHYIEGEDVVELGSLVSISLRMAPRAVTEWLTDSASGVLGPRRLILPRATKFQWNPADDHVAAIVVERLAGPRPSFDAEIWTLAPVIPD